MQPSSPMRTLRAALTLVAAGVVLGLASNAGWHPRRIPWFEDWTARTAAKEQKVSQQAVQSGAETLGFEQVLALVTAPVPTHQIFDARKPELYDQGHLPGAFSLPLAHFAEKFAEYHAILRREDPVLVYCSGRSCDESLELARRLREQGFTRVSIYLGGFEEWRAKGGPVE